MVICNNFVQLSKILCNKDGQTKWLLRPSRTTILDNISHLKSSRIASLCPPPYGQPDRKNTVFFLTTSLTNIKLLLLFQIKRYWLKTILPKSLPIFVDSLEIQLMSRLLVFWWWADVSTGTLRARKLQSMSQTYERPAVLFVFYFHHASQYSWFRGLT